MCKKMRITFYFLIMLMLVGCKAQGSDFQEQAMVSESPAEKSEETSTELSAKASAAVHTATPILTPEVESEQTPRPKGDIPERSYDSLRDFPYEAMDFVDNVTFEFLRKTYGEIDFYGEFQTGDLSVYDEYIEAYRKLLNSEISFVVQDSSSLPQIGESYYMKDYSTVRKGDKYDPREFNYCLFDMDGNGTPELSIRDCGAYVFKYDAQSKEMILWLDANALYERIHGTLSLGHDWGGVRHTLCRLNEKGELIFGVYFLTEGCWSNGKTAFMVTVPTYEDKEIEITMDMKKQAYYSEEDGIYYFNVTEEQYDELTKEYFQAWEQSEEELKNITYTYDELFNASGTTDTVKSKTQ